MCSPDDLDACMTHGLARRWAVIGPFQVMLSNAPNGVSDYCARYGESMNRVLKDMAERGTPDMSGGSALPVVNAAMAAHASSAEDIERIRSHRDCQLAAMAHLFGDHMQGGEGGEKE